MLVKFRKCLNNWTNFFAKMDNQEYLRVERWIDKKRNRRGGTCQNNDCKWACFQKATRRWRSGPGRWLCHSYSYASVRKRRNARVLLCYADSLSEFYKSSFLTSRTLPTTSQILINHVSTVICEIRIVEVNLHRWCNDSYSTEIFNRKKINPHSEFCGS